MEMRADQERRKEGHNCPSQEETKAKGFQREHVTRQVRKDCCEQSFFLLLNSSTQTKHNDERSLIVSIKRLEENLELLSELPILL